MKLIEEGGKERTVIEEKIKTMVKNFQVHYFCFNYKFAKVLIKYYTTNYTGSRGGSTTAATSKMELFVIIVNGFQPLTFVTVWSILDVAAVLDPPLGSNLFVA